MTNTHSPQNRRRSVGRFAAVLLAGALVVAACGDDDDSDVSSDDEVPTETETDTGDDSAADCADGVTDCDDVLDPDDSDSDDAGGTRPAGSGEDFGPAGEPLDGDGSMSMCAADAPDCNDMPDPDAGGDADPDAIDEGAMIREAEELLGTPESELTEGPDLRIGRRGDEQMMLTQDYVVGRMTVELDDEGGTFVVTRVTVELTEGPQVVE